MTTSPMATHGAPSWIEHCGADPAAARGFYEKVLGWAVTELPMQDGSSYPGILVGEAPVGGFRPHPAKDGGWMIFITVDNVDSRYAAALEAGAKGLSEPTSIPGVGRMATISDPFGAAIAFITYEKKAS